MNVNEMRNFLLKTIILSCFIPSTLLANSSIDQPIEIPIEQKSIIDPKAQYDLALKYDGFLATDDEKRMAFYWYEKAAIQGYQPAAFNLAYFYENGIGTSKDLEQALYWYQRSFPLDNNKQKNKQKNTHYDFLDYYLAAANHDYSYAQYRLAVIYEDGNSYQDADLKQALYWYEKAAQLNDSLAMNNLGYIYEVGKMVKKDYAKSLMWYQKAADLGNSIAQSNLGLMYQYGRGCKIDYQEAIKWYEKSAKQGYTRAMNFLAELYQEGSSIPQDNDKAIYWYTKGAELNDALSQLYLSFWKGC